MEAKFERLLKEHATVDFMGTVKWFLGTHFQWMVTPELVPMEDKSSTEKLVNIIREVFSNQLLIRFLFQEILIEGRL